MDDRPEIVRESPSSCNAARKAISGNALSTVEYTSTITEQMFAAKLRAAGAAAAAGTNAHIRLKVNALTDPAVMEDLYSASRQGAQVEIVARSICSAPRSRRAVGLA